MWAEETKNYGRLASGSHAQSEVGVPALAGRTLKSPRIAEYCEQHWLKPGLQLLLLQVVTKEQVLITQVEFATGYDGMGPAILFAAIRLGKPTRFFIASW